MKHIAITLQDDYIALCNLLKVAGVAGSAGQGKHMVAAGEVRVDGQPESRKTAKIRAGQQVDCLGSRISVVAANDTAQEGA
jgi:ribosome-associated protein